MEGKSFLSPTEKKYGAPDPIPRFGSPRRDKTHSARSQPHSPLSVPAGDVKFRILCLASRVGAVIGIRGSVIKQIQQSTKSKIWVEDAPLGSPDRVITVIAEGGSTSRLKLGAGYGDEEEEGEEEVEVSEAQDALIRVFEVLNDGFGTGTVSCRLLMEASHVGAVKGKGSKMVEMIMKDTRCKVEIGTDNLPICADHDDALVEIEGNVLAVKKALVSVSSRLQACQQICKTRIVPHDALRRNMDVVPREVLYRSSDVSQGDVSRQHREVDPRDSLHRLSEIGQRKSFPPDAYQRRIETVTQETLSQPMINFRSRRGSVLDTHPHTIKQPLSESDVSQVDVSRQHREVALRDSMHRNFEIGQRDALGRSLESLPPYAYQRRNETITQEISRHGSVIDTNPHSITSSRSKNHPVTIEQPLSESDDDDDNENIVLKILCPTESAGGVIGPGGTNIMTIERETGALIDVGDTPANCDECLITITSEIPRDRRSPAQRAILLVFSKLFEIFPRKIYKSDWMLHPDSIGSRSFITARLVVSTNQIGCLLGSSDVWTAVEASILVLAVDENPKCISANDQVLQISGEFPTVKKVIYIVTSMLRSNLLLNSGPFSATKSNALNSMGFHPSPSQSPTMSTSLPRRSEDSLQWGSHNPVNSFKPDDYSLRVLYSLLPSELRASPPPGAPRGAYDGSGGLSSTMADPGLDSGHEYQRTNTTVEIRVPEKAVKFVCGEDDGHNRLEAVKQISGARVIVHEPHLGTSDRIIAISGTPNQTKTAQRLLHAFILIGESVSLVERLGLHCTQTFS